MKLNGALKPHRADSNCWNDSFGGHNYNNNNQFNKPNQQYQQNTNRNNQSFNNNNNNKQKPTICKRTPMDLFGCACKRLAKNTRSAITSLKMMRIQQSPPSKSPFLFSTRRIFHYSALRSILLVLWVFTNRVLCDDNENGFFVNGYSLGPESTTPEFDYASRGSKKFGDKCESTLECGFPGSICDPRKKSCQCTEDLPVTNHIDKCGKEAAINETCFFNEQCEAFHFQTECRDSRCICRFEMSPIVNKDGNIECKGKQMNHEVERYVDPAMIGVLVGMALMFIIICVVLRLFSRARWRENRTIFNTPNPRLMNVSLLRDNKLLHGQERRGSRMSVRAPSRQPSMASLRPHSPNPSLASSRPDSRGSSNASATSTRSQRSNSAVAAPTTAATTNINNHHQHQHQHHHHHHHQQHNNSVNETKPENSNTNAHNKSLIVTNITENPAVDSVTVEIIEPKNS